MKVGILGSGPVGEALANGFLKYKYDVMRGSRSPEKLSDWKKKASEKAKTGNFQETAAFADVVVLAVKGEAAMSALTLCGAENLKGKTIIDCTNPIASESPENGVLRLFTSINFSLMEELQSKFPEAKFVKAFNSVGNQFMVNPDFGGIKPTMFMCGKDSNSKKQVREILDQFGWEIEDMGEVEAARAIEPLCMLWCIPGFRNNEWSHAFKLLKKTE